MQYNNTNNKPKVTVSTYFALMAEFGSAQIPLEDLCKKYFNLSFAEAKKKAAKQMLPVPVFKMKNVEDGRYYVKAEKLAEYIDKQSEAAELEWQSVNSPSKNKAA
jgi:hypothetical protein